MKKHIFIVGAKSLGAYGGYETFVDKLTEYHQENEQIQYHVAVKANGQGYLDESKLKDVKQISKDRFLYHNADCFKINVPQIGPAQAIYYDFAALDNCCKYIKKNNIEHPIVYILACRIGIFIKYFYKRIHALGGEVYINPDGHEWARGKWGRFTRKYWKYSEKRMVKYSDKVICDSINIESYIHECYDKQGLEGKNPVTSFIAYGAETRKSKLKDTDDNVIMWYEKNKVRPKEYYLVVGRFVPENNYETMIREFILSDTKKDLVIITNENEKLFMKINEMLHFTEDNRIKFVGTVYDKELLMKIRENAYGYFHGHEVGGTNPSLLEALGSSDLSLLLDVGFNREVAENSALYWNKEKGNMSHLISCADRMTSDEIADYAVKSTKRIEEVYSWQRICDQYEEIWREA